MNTCSAVLCDDSNGLLMGGPVFYRGSGRPNLIPTNRSGETGAQS